MPKLGMEKPVLGRKLCDILVFAPTACFPIYGVIFNLRVVSNRKKCGSTNQHQQKHWIFCRCISLVKYFKFHTGRLIRIRQPHKKDGKYIAIFFNMISNNNLNDTHCQMSGTTKNKNIFRALEPRGI